MAIFTRPSSVILFLTSLSEYVIGKTHLIIIHGQYLDEFIKQNGEWYFSKRTFSILHDYLEE